MRDFTFQQKSQRRLTAGQIVRPTRIAGLLARVRLAANKSGSLPAEILLT
jgi:hypothetical protein